MTTKTSFAAVLSLAALVTACSGGSTRSTTIGAAGGFLTTASGITLTVPAGALARETEVRVVETQPRDGAMARVELEPHDLGLAAPATLAFKVEDGNVRLSEIEHGPEGEVRHGLDKRRHGGRGEVEVEVHRLGEIEMEHGRTCDVACGTGFECDDGVCKAHAEDDPATHDVGDDKGMDDPATHDVGDDKGTDDPATHDVGDDKGTDDPATHDVGDDNGNDGPGHT